MAKRAKSATVPYLTAAAGRGIVIQISGDGEGAKRALEMVREELRTTAGQSDRTTAAMGRMHSELEHGVPKMAAASAGLRALEGNFTNNIRAGERFLTMIPGMSTALSAAFPVVGAVVLTTALVKMGEEAFHTFQNIVLLKGAIDSLNQLDITVGKKLQRDADEQESALEQMLERTQNKAAALKQKLAYQSGKGVDLGDDLFYQKEYKDLPTNVKANYEKLYKAVAPADIPDRLSRIRKELTSLHSALDQVKSGTGGAFVPIVNGYGPKTFEDPTKYYEARIKAATDVQKMLASESGRRQSNLDDIQNELLHPKHKDGADTGNSVAEARARLQEQEARTALAQRKAAGQIMLAEWESQHKEELVTDQAFYAKKLELQLGELDDEEKALNQKGKALTDLLARQSSDRKLKTSGGVSAEELKTQAELKKVDEERAALQAKRGQLTSANDADEVLRQQTAEIASLRIAAELEKERNAGIEAQIALSRREHEEQAKKVTAAGGSDADAAAVRATGELAVGKLQLGEAQRQINDVEAEYRRKIDDTNDAVSKGQTSKRQAAKDIDAWQKQEAARLQILVDKYTKLAKLQGGDAVQQALNLQEQLTKLQRHDRTQDGDYKFAQGLKSMTDSIVDSTAQAQQSFSKMAESILRDIDRMALKFVEQRFIDPLFEPGSPSGDGTSGGGGLASVLPKLGGFWKPPAAKSGGSGAGSMLASIAQTAAKGLAPNITTHLNNNSSQQLQMGQPETSFDEYLNQWHLNFHMEDFATGGQLRQLYSPG